MATKNTRDNTYYSVAKVFTFSSVMLILLPIVNIILTFVGTKGGAPAGIWKAVEVLSYITLALVIIWLILNIVMFVCAGNLRGIKSPMGIRLGLLVSMALAFAGTIVYLLAILGKINVPSGGAGKALVIGLAVAQVLGFIIATIIGHNIKKALKQ